MSFTLSIKSLFVSEQSNESLMMRFVDSGDSKALAQLYDNCANDLYHFLLTHSDSVLAKDICQKTWVKVIEKKHLYRNKGRFIAWLFTMGRNILIDEQRSTNKMEYREEAGLHVSTSDPLPEALSARFDHALMSLPQEQREAFCLQQEGFGMQEIADITHSNPETIKSRIRYAKSALRRMLEDCHDQIQ